MLAAWCAIAGAAMTMALGGIPPLAALEAQTPSPWWISAANAVSHLLLIAGVAGVARAGAAGRGRLGLAGLAGTLLGLAVLTVAEIVSLGDTDVAIVLFSAATLLMGLGLLLLGVAVLRARCWTGWHRFTPLACGLFIFLVLLPSFALPEPASNYMIGVWGVCWLLLGLALRAEAAGRA
jgi:hypothetical protein